MIKISAVIPLAPERNAPILKSLKKMNYPKANFEIIVEVGKNPSENRNRGIKKAKGEIIAILDDDAIVDKNLFKNAEEFFNKHPEIDIIGGPQLTPKTDKFFARISGYVISSYFGTSSMSKRYKQGKLNLDADEFSLTSANCFIRKKVFKTIKGFDTRLFPGEDPEFFDRAKKEGCNLAYVPNLTIYHKRRPTVSGFCKQFYLYGKVRMKKENLRKTRINPLFLTPSAFIIYLITLPLGIIFKLYLLPLLLYSLIVLLNSIYLTIKYKDLLSFPFLLFIYPLLHISYGIGMIKGILNG